MADSTSGRLATTQDAIVAPQPLSQIEDAPARGIIPNISLHLTSLPQLFHLDDQPIEKVTELLSRQYLYGTNMTFVKWIAKAGATISLTHHASEQITWFIEGRAEVYSQGKKFIMKAGDIMIIPANVPHEFIYLEDTIDIDIFAPGRQDWIDGTAHYK